MDLYTDHREGWPRRFLDGVLGGVRWQISNGRLEGMNNRIRLLRHRSSGLHSAEALISLVYLCCGGLELQGLHGK
jgi:transposase